MFKDLPWDWSGGASSSEEICTWALLVSDMLIFPKYCCVGGVMFGGNNVLITWFLLSMKVPTCYFICL